MDSSVKFQAYTGQLSGMAQYIFLNTLMPYCEEMSGR